MKDRFLRKKRHVLTLVLAIIFVVIIISYGLAEAPMVKSQTPGYYRMMMGDFEVTALCDGSIEVGTNILRNATESEISSLLDRMFVTGTRIKSVVNGYLINTGSKLVLVDAGAGKLFGATLGLLMSNLKASGYSPEQVDAVLISHLHGDHVGGLLDASGKPAFPKAVVYISKAENDFWLSANEAEKAPAEFKGYFEMANEVSSPYAAVGKWRTFLDGESPVAGIKAVLIPGHTPGHTAFEVASGTGKLLITGDMVHVAAVQFPRPEIAVSFDKDPKQAVSTRLEVLRNAARNRTLVAGMHLPFPGIGMIRSDGTNTYTWVPVPFSPVP